MKIQHYIIAVLSITVTALICVPVAKAQGYYVVSFILLIVVSILATFLRTGPVLLASLSGILIWNFFFIPPHFTFHIEKTQDILMFGMFGLVVIMNGVFTTRVRRQEKLAREREANTNALLQLTREAKFLAESEKLYKTLFNSVSHELRIPVAAIMAASDALQVSAGSDGMQAALAREISMASLRLNRLIENLLNMSRLESGRIAPRLDWVDLNDLVNQVQNDLKEELKPYKILIEIPESIPLIKVDFGLMEQALYNLLINSCQNAPAGSEISVLAGYGEGRLSIWVLDRGPGFSEADLMGVFDKFYRSGERGTGGLGLGLSIVKGFVEAHNGMVTVANRAGGGAEVVIFIPTEVPEMNELSMEKEDAE
jgi:two-component system sensor histidine kinase KdpD